MPGGGKGGGGKGGENQRGKSVEAVMQWCAGSRVAPAQIPRQATSAAAKKSRRVLLAFTLTLPARGVSRAGSSPA